VGEHRRHQQQFKDSYSPGIGVLLSREFGEHGSVYAEPLWVNKHQSPSRRNWPTTTTRFIIGLGARVRVRPTVFLLVEAAPRNQRLRPGCDARQLRHREARRRATCSN
jgi:hypothetical protein